MKRLTSYIMHRATSIVILVAAFFYCVGAQAAERAILIGPKTIGRGWKDHIVIQPAQFQNVAAGDMLTLYTADARGSAQGTFQNPKTWEAIAPEYGYFNINGPFRMKITEAMIPILKEHGLSIGGHDYKIMLVTLIPAAEISETVVYNGPSMQMKDDWSANCDIQKKVFEDVRVGDGIRFHVSKVKDGAAFKLSDIMWNPIDASLDGAPLGGDSFTYYIYDPTQLVKLQWAGADGVSVHVGGKGYQFDKISIVRFTGGVDEDYSTAQRAPKEYELRPGELFRGEQEFPNDFSGNLRLTAAPFQDITNAADYQLVVCYKLLPGLAEAGITPKVSFRENRGAWHDLTGTQEPVWYDLDGRNFVYHLNEVSLDKVKTRGLVITGQGFILTKVVLLKTTVE